LRPRLTAKLDALILRESEELGWSLIRNSGVIMQRVDSWDNMHGGAALFTEWGKRLAIATRIRHGQKRPRISDNLIEYKSKLKTVAELQRVAAKLRALDLDDRLPTRDAQVKAIISAIGSIIQRDSRKLSQLADPFNLKLWMDFFQANEDALFLAANCDEDESLVRSYLEADKFPMPVVFADGLDRFFTVDSFPTVLVIDRAGKIAYRSDGFEPDTFETNLATAVRSALAPLSASSPPAKPAP